MFTANIPTSSSSSLPPTSFDILHFQILWPSLLERSVANFLNHWHSGSTQSFIIILMVSEHSPLPTDICNIIVLNDH
jgi:hypothetical protein